MRKQVTTRKKQKYKKVNQQYREKKKKKKTHAHTMRITAAGRDRLHRSQKLTWKVALEAYCGRDARKDPALDSGRQSGRGGDRRRTQNSLEGESLSESPKSSTHRVCQTSKSNRKTIHQ